MKKVYVLTIATFKGRGENDSMVFEKKEDALNTMEQLVNDIKDMEWGVKVIEDDYCYLEHWKRGCFTYSVKECVIR